MNGAEVRDRSGVKSALDFGSRRRRKANDIGVILRQEGSHSGKS